MSENQLIHIKIPVMMHAAINRQKRRQNKTQSAIVREALAMWLERHGDIVDPTAVQWGGFRSNK